MNKKIFAAALAVITLPAFATGDHGKPSKPSTPSTTVSNRISNDVRNTAVAFANSRASSSALSGSVSGATGGAGGQGGVGGAGGSGGLGFGGQGGASSSGPSTSTSSGGSIGSVTSSITYEKPVAALSLGSLYPSAPCMGTSNFGGGNPFFNIGGGTSWESSECNIRETARSFSGLGLTADALAILCTSEHAKAAPSCIALAKPKE